MGSPIVWLTALGCLLACVIVVGIFGSLLSRRLRELRAGGIDVALRAHRAEPGRGWHLGVAHYQGEEFTWYRALSLRSGPNCVVNRRRIEITARRDPAHAELYTMPSRSVVLHLAGEAGDIELAMGPDALTGFLSWLESAPPGRAVPWAS